MRKLAEQLWWVDEVSSVAGVYLWHDSDGLILFDSGMPWQAHIILNALSKAGFTPTRVHHVLITHADVDHAGGARAVKEATGAALACHGVTAAILQGRLPRKFGLGLLGDLASLATWAMMGPIFHTIPLRADELIVDGEPLPGGFKAIYTPGHCAGHTSFYHPGSRVLIVGDAVRNVSRGLAVPPPILVSDRASVIRSVEKLARLDAAIACFGHHRPAVGDVQARFRALSEKLQAG